MNGPDWIRWKALKGRLILLHGLEEIPPLDNSFGPCPWGSILFESFLSRLWTTASAWAMGSSLPVTFPSRLPALWILDSASPHNHISQLLVIYIYTHYINYIIYIKYISYHTYDDIYHTSSAPLVESDWYIHPQIPWSPFSPSNSHEKNKILDESNIQSTLWLYKPKVLKDIWGEVYITGER